MCAVRQTCTPFSMHRFAHHCPERTRAFLTVDFRTCANAPVSLEFLKLDRLPVRGALEETRLGCTGMACTNDSTQTKWVIEFIENEAMSQSQSQVKCMFNSSAHRSMGTRRLVFRTSPCAFHQRRRLCLRGAFIDPL